MAKKKRARVTTSPARARREGSKKRAGYGAASGVVSAWQDDPVSAGQDGRPAQPVERPTPDLGGGELRATIRQARPAPGVYAPGTAEFRYWTAADALRRGLDFWAPLLPTGTRFQTGGAVTIPVSLDDAEEDANAYYVRERGLEFKHMPLSGRTLFTGESPDIILHELGHAVLDAIRPELYDAASTEVAAFHEAFGDISAILVGATLPGLADTALAETGGVLNRSSQLSRLMESLGWGVRVFRPDRAPPDCLRNAVNSWFYQAPDGLPPDGPHTSLTSAPHSFSRVFTGGFFEAMSGMLSIVADGKNPTADHLGTVAKDAARLLVAAVRSAPVRPDFFAQVAAHLVVADSQAGAGAGRFGTALRSALVRRGLLSLESARALAELPAGTVRRATTKRGRALALGAGGAPGSALRTRIAGERLGLGAVGVFVSAPGQARSVAAAAGVGNGRPVDISYDESSRNFLENLMRRGRVQMPASGSAAAPLENPWSRKTHALRRINGDAELVRISFDCHSLD